MICIGGGIAGDICAFAASIYKRGLKLMKYHLMTPSPGVVKDDRMRFV